MMKPKRTRRSVSIDEKIQSAREVIARTKARYDKEVSFLKFLLDSKRPVRYMSGGRTKADRKLKNYFEAGFQNGGSRESI